MTDVRRDNNLTTVLGNRNQTKVKGNSNITTVIGSDNQVVKKVYSPRRQRTTVVKPGVKVVGDNNISTVFGNGNRSASMATATSRRPSATTIKAKRSVTTR